MKKRTMRIAAGPFFTLAEVYLAYRKAKVEAFYENTHFNALAFSEYESNLYWNLKRLQDLLNSRSDVWTKNSSMLGGYSYAPKSVENFEGSDKSDPQLRAINPLEEWQNCFLRGGKKRTSASFRLIITPTVNFQIISALWILKVGHIFDAHLDDDHVYANRVRRIGGRDHTGGKSSQEFNRDCLGIFPPYFSAYRKWRENGLIAMRKSLASDNRIIAITMDLKSFYHNVSPEFLIDRQYHKILGLKLSEREFQFTENFIQAIDTWYQRTPDYKVRQEGAIPVGLSASKVIANVLLHEFDKEVVRRLLPIYYGRYVDDIFLVLRRTGNEITADEILKSLSSALEPMLKYEVSSAEESSLRLNLSYAKKSELIFTGSKQKIFDLSGDYGLDLVRHISEQIRSQSSEHRLLAELPDTDVEMATRALLATPDATLEADALRKADVVSVRRLGFSLLLRDVEAYARDLRSGSWKSLRQKFYQIVHRYLLTPRGFFDYTGYLHRIFGLMVSCADFEAVDLFLIRFGRIASLLRSTSTAGTTERVKFERCLTYYCSAFVQTALQASTVDRFEKWRQLGKCLKLVSHIGQISPIKTTPGLLRRLGERILLTDWGKRPYKDYWFYSQSADKNGPPVPSETAVRRLIRLGGIRKFRKYAELKMPFWPALAFPTRPLSVAEIGVIAPRVLAGPSRLRDAIMALRGARVATDEVIGIDETSNLDADNPGHFFVPDDSKRSPRIAITSVQTTDRQWSMALLGRPDHSIKRYQALLNLINRILMEHPRARYVSFPECSIPLKWALRIAGKLARNRVSFLAGLEYYYDKKRKRWRNDCLISLTTTWPGYPSNIIRLQPKLLPAHNERIQIKKHSNTPLYEPKGLDAILPVYVHGDLYFGMLLCSDLTNITNRKYFQGAVDALFVLEWNPDVRTFSFLVEATAHDIHAFVVQVNNRAYGDSRIRAPYKDDHQKDLVRVKGGISDYYVLSSIDQYSLRQFQRRSRKTGDGNFKPLPIGFVMSDARKAAAK